MFSKLPRHFLVWGKIFFSSRLSWTQMKTSKQMKRYEQTQHGIKLWMNKKIKGQQLFSFCPSNKKNAVRNLSQEGVLGSTLSEVWV